MRAGRHPPPRRVNYRSLSLPHREVPPPPTHTPSARTRTHQRMRWRTRARTRARRSGGAARACMLRARARAPRRTGPGCTGPGRAGPGRAGSGRPFSRPRIPLCPPCLLFAHAGKSPSPRPWIRVRESRQAHAVSDLVRFTLDLSCPPLPGPWPAAGSGTASLSGGRGPRSPSHRRSRLGPRPGPQSSRPP